jgi:FtsP/CotA-like multicopper oxidase with cupredoxin domain
VYRFRATQTGTFWYHTHQASSDEVRRGLFGAFVIRPADAELVGIDMTVLSHLFSSTPTLNGVVGTHRQEVEPGTPVRLRLVNTDSAPQRFTLAGTPYRVAAIDGTELNRPTPLDATPLVLAAGGRYDLTFEMPLGAVALRGAGQSELVLSPGGTRPAPAAGDEGLPAFDPLTYGAPAPTAFDADSTFDREFRFDITRKIGFFNGRPGRQWAINDRIYPDVPTFSVAEGDLVKVTISNRSGSIHPMHLHGHHLLVLSRNGVEAGGSPWWTDTLDVESGDDFEVAFRADNPGVWMDHCHNLTHAAKGLTMHVAYAGVTTPFEVGGEHDNRPE